MSTLVLFCLLIYGLNENYSSPIPDIYTKYKDVANRIIDYTVNGAGKGQTYKRLAAFTDKFGYRMAGTENLENSIDYMLEEMELDHLDNVHGENVSVPRWVRGKEHATLISPRRHKMNILGLGGSIATPKEGITAEAIVVRSFKELQSKRKMAKGKIIVFNQPFVSYPATSGYRVWGAKEASKVGALATLIRSVTPFSIDSPHTGWQQYGKGVTPIPTACITVEDAEMLDRMHQRGDNLTISLYMEAANLPWVQSRNVVAERLGSSHPEQIVLISGHLDSWDVGQGAMDDGGGALISWQGVSILRQLNLRPKRTVRTVLWTAEEEGRIGSTAYFNRHKKNINNYSLVMESDSGTFTPLGIKFTGSKEARGIMEKVLELLTPINATVLSGPADGGDVALWIQNGVPGGSLYNQNQKYFYFHHSNGDTMTVENSEQLDLCAAVWTVVSYVIADLDSMLPRGRR